MEREQSEELGRLLDTQLQLHRPIQLVEPSHDEPLHLEVRHWVQLLEHVEEAPAERQRLLPQFLTPVQLLQQELLEKGEVFYVVEPDARRPRHLVRHLEASFECVVEVVVASHPCPSSLLVYWYQLQLREVC